MSTKYVADDFSGSGVVHGSAVLRSGISAGNWAEGDFYAPGSNYLSRSGSGLVGVDSVADDTLYLSATPSLALGSGVAVFEVAGWGQLGLYLRIGASPSVYSIISLDRYVGAGTDTTWVAPDASTGSVSTGAWTDSSLGTLRIEVDSGATRFYVDGVLKSTSAAVATNSVHRIALRLDFGASFGSARPVPFSGSVIKYVNSLVGGVSGALGWDQGGNILLPHPLVYNAGEFRKGRGVNHLPSLYYPAQPAPPSFWTRRVNSREIP